MRRLAQRTIVTALGLALVTVPLTGCFGTNGPDPNATKTATDTDTTDTDTDTTDTEDINVRTPTGDSDYNTWKTLGDAFAAANENPSYGCDDVYYLGVIPVEGKKIYVISKLTAEAYEAFQKSDDVSTQEEALAELPIAYKDDITDKVFPQTALDTLVGKTGQDLMNAGYIFRGYSAYGSTDASATFDYGFYSYEFTFKATVPEDAIEDNGESIKAATITAVESYGNFSDLCMNPTEFTKIPELAAAGFVVAPTADATAEAATADGATDGTADASADTNAIATTEEAAV